MWKSKCNIVLYLLLIVQCGSVHPLEFHVAPMQCYTGKPLRRLYSFLSEKAILWTEMEKIGDLMKSRKDMEKRIGLESYYDESGGAGVTESTRPSPYTVLQFGGSDVDALTYCIEQVSSRYNNHYMEYNLNCGCPSIESGGSSDFGASLMKQPLLTRDLLHNMRTTTGSSRNTSSYHTTISLKCRIGVHDHYSDMMEDDKYYIDSLCDFLSIVLGDSASTTADAGATGSADDVAGPSSMKGTGAPPPPAACCVVDHVVVHARPAILTGLSPQKNRVVPPLRYNVVHAVAQRFPAVKFTLNGGIGSLADLEEHIHNSTLHYQSLPPAPPGVRSFMAGRWLLRRPLDLAWVDELLLANRILHSQSQLSSPLNLADPDPVSTTAVPSISFFSSSSSSSSSSYVPSSEARRCEFALQQYNQYVHKTLLHQSRAGSRSEIVESAVSLTLPLYLVALQLKSDYLAITEAIDKSNNNNTTSTTTTTITNNSTPHSPTSTASITGTGKSSVSYQHERVYLHEIEIYVLYNILVDTLDCIQSFVHPNDHTHNGGGYRYFPTELNFRPLFRVFQTVLGKKQINKIKKNVLEI